jgi:hypothetical protein
MPITTPDFITRLSGGASNSDPNASLGGVISSSAAPGSLFDDVSAAEAEAGRVEYRCVYLRNASATDTMIAAAVYVASDTPLESTSVALGVGTSAVNGSEPTVASETAAPAGVTFSAPATPATGLALGNIPPGQHRAFWVRRTVDAESGSSASDTWQIGYRCETA